MSAPGSPSTQTSQVLGMVRWLLIATFVVLGWFALSFLASVLAPILAALGIAYLLNPVLDRLCRRGLGRGVGAALLLVSFLTVIVGAIAVLAPKAADQIAQFIHDLPQMFDNLSAWTQSHLGVELPAEWKESFSSHHLGSAIGNSEPLRHLATAALGGVFHLLGLVAELLLVPVFAFYFLVDWPNLLRRIDHVIPPRRRRDVREVLREIDGVVAGWVRGQGIVTSILAVLYAVGFGLVGMPLWLPIGLLVGALTVIPFVGTFVGASIAALVTIADGGSMQTLGMVGGVIGMLHILEAGVLTPKIVGHRVGLSETGALFAVVAGGKLLGFVGVVLAVPIAATCAVLVRYAVRYYEHTAFFGRESDADVEITPAMATIMPGVHVVPAPFEVGTGETSTPWTGEPELGEAGPAHGEPDETP